VSAGARTRVRVSREGSVLVLALEQPYGYPRLERSVLADISDAIWNAATDSSLSGVVIQGTEKCFAAGADIDELALLSPLSARQFSLLGQSLMSQIERFSKPVIAAVRGYCLGGGLDLALACHIRIASFDARLAHPGGALGILTGWGGTQRLPRTLLPGGRAGALELFSTGVVIEAAEAFRIGLVNRLSAADEVLPAAVKFAAEKKS
jgi:enoyl-CoA hydratase